MRIGLEISALTSGHASRGIGTYTTLLRDALHKYTDHEIVDVHAGAIPPGIDIVHYPMFDLVGSTFKHTSSVPFVVTVHDVIPLRFAQHFPVGIRGSIRSYFNKRSLKEASAIITDSHVSQADICQYLNISENAIHVVHLAPKKKLPVNALPSKKPYLLYVGDVNWNKNVLGLLKAFSNVNKNYPDLRLMLVSRTLKNSDIPETRKLRSYIQDNDLSSRVDIHGLVSDKQLATLYAHARVYVQPSWYEGFGLPVLEAMQYGTPVVSSDRGSLPEVGGSAPIYGNPGRVVAFALAIEKALKWTKKQRSSYAKRSIAHAKIFSWKKTALKTIKVYEHILTS